MVSAAVLDSAGKLVMEGVLETKAETILQFIQGLRGKFAGDFGRRNLCDVVARRTEAAWGTSVRVRSAQERAEHGREQKRSHRWPTFCTWTSSIFHGETGNRALKELARSYLALTRDTMRVMNRLKIVALYMSFDKRP